MINLVDNPEKSLELQHGDHVIVNGIEFNVSDGYIENTIYLTTVTSRVAEYNQRNRRWDQYGGMENQVRYQDFVTHLRVPCDDVTMGTAVLTREALMNALHSNTFVIQ